MMRAAAFLTIIASLFVTAGVVPAGTLAQTDQPIPEYKLNAYMGKIAPNSPFYFIMNLADGMKLATAFSQDAKLMKHMDIGNRQIAEMKVMIERKEDETVKTVINRYKANISAIASSIEKKKPNQEAKKTLSSRIQQHDDAFMHLFGLADDKTEPLLRDAWSQLQNLKPKLQ